MEESTKVTTTRVEGWEAICRKWAETNEPFEVHDISARHLNFCRELCDSFEYQCEYDSRDEDRAAIFVPLSD